jgi:hypothetical protein
VDGGVVAGLNNSLTLRWRGGRLRVGGVLVRERLVYPLRIG